MATKLAQLAEELLGALRNATKVAAKDPQAVVASVKAFPFLEMASPELATQFVAAAAGSSVGALATVSPALAALSLASPPAAALAMSHPDLAKVAVLSPETAELAIESPELRAIARESPAHAILATRAIIALRK